jgi:hypothetical protein
MNRIIRAFAAFCLVAVVSGQALAVPRAGAFLLEFDTSVRSEGMGGAGVAAHWGGDPDIWANPANIAYQQGLRYSEMESRLAPDLADDIWLRDQWVVLGGNGFGLYFARGPIEGAFLDMGPQGYTGDSGEFTEEFNSWSSAERAGAGISLVRMLEAWGGRDDPGLSRIIDISAGYVHTEFEDHLAPDGVTQSQLGGGVSGTARSYGAMARLTPLNTLGETYSAGPLGGVRLNIAYGMSVLNQSDEMLVHVDTDHGDPFPTAYVKGWSVQAQTGFPPSLRKAFQSVHMGWLADSLTPLVSFGYAEQLIEPGVMWNDEIGESEYTHDTSGLYDEESWGWELSVANIWHLRKGHRKTWSGIDGDTEGHGIGFQLGSLGGVRWDKATVPQVTGFSDVERESWTVWINLTSLLN